jgi:uroporphyrinogen decarboxylase
VTLQPVDRFGMDAAILFSDILVLADCLGFEVRFEPGPVLDTPVRTEADVRRLPLHDPEERVPFVFETVRILRRALEGRVPLIGFAAAPFTLASYLVEGAGSKSFVGIKRMLYGEPGSAHALLDKIATATERYLLAQVRAGAQAIQLFDTWAGLLAPDAYREFALRWARRVLQGPPMSSESTGGSPWIELPSGWEGDSSCRATSIPARCSRRPPSSRKGPVRF